jgi:putative transcriptional regulator
MMTPTTRLYVGAILLSTVANGFTSIPRPAGQTCHQSKTTSASSSSSSSSLHGSSSDRARSEREFEDMMGNDWRAFRAKLVAQEANGGIPVAPRTVHAHHREQQQRQQQQHHNQDKSLNRQSQLGDIFARSISSIFDGGNTNQMPLQHKSNPSANHRGRRQYEEDMYSSEPFSSNNDHGLHNTLQSYDDPFVSAAELPLFFPETKINKHRWAHEIPHVEPGCVLIANEKLGGVFHQTVVLIIQNCERRGAIGMVINRYVFICAVAALPSLLYCHERHK